MFSAVCLAGLNLNRLRVNDRVASKGAVCVSHGAGKVTRMLPRGLPGRNFGISVRAVAEAVIQLSYAGATSRIRRAGLPHNLRSVSLNGMMRLIAPVESRTADLARPKACAALCISDCILLAQENWLDAGRSTGVPFYGLFTANFSLWRQLSPASCPRARDPYLQARVAQIGSVQLGHVSFVLQHGGVTSQN